MGLLPFEQRTYSIMKRGTHDVLLDVAPPYAVSELLTRGVICINKPRGPTSHMVSEYVQQIIGVESAGHGGTLDPSVTGVLPVALGKSTRLVQALLPAGKEYVCLMVLHAMRDPANIQSACKTIIGKIKQIPPVKSAVKRVEREREIYYIDVLEIADREVLFAIGCEGGTYIRKLCEQLGAMLGTNAHMQQLVRTKSGPFTYSEAVTLHELEDALGYYHDGDETAIRKCILPPEHAIAHLPKVYAFETTLGSLRHGVDLKLPGVAYYDSDIAPEQLVSILGTDQRLIALGIAKSTAQEFATTEKGIAVQTTKVFLEQTHSMKED